MIQSGNFQGAISRYEWLAESGANRDHWRLEAADTALRAGDAGYARRVAQTLNARDLIKIDQDRLILIESRLDLNEGNAQSALSRLDRLKESTLTEADLRNDHVLRASAFNQLGEMKRSAKERMALTSLITRPEERVTNDARIFETLSQLQSEDLNPSQSDDLEMRSWLALTRLLEETPREKRREAVRNWQDQFPKNSVSAAFLDDQMGKNPTFPSDRTQSQGPGKTLKEDAFIGVLLPMQGAYARAGVAIRVGLEAAFAADSEPNKVPLKFIDTSGGGIVQAALEAKKGGAVGLIGPLVKEDLSKILSLKDLRIHAVALNALEGTPPPEIIEFALTPEAELDQLSAEILAQDIRSAALVLPDTPFGQRLGQYFDTVWRKQGGTTLGQATFVPRSEGLGEVVRHLPALREDSALVIIADPEDARAIAPHLPSLGDIRVFAPGKIYDGRNDLPANGVLNAIRFCDMPFLLSPDQDGPLSSRALLQKVPADIPDAARLIAFGLDAYPLFKASLKDPLLSAPISGATGVLFLGENRKVLRQLSCARFDRSTPVLEGLAPLPLNLNKDPHG